MTWAAAAAGSAAAVGSIYSSQQASQSQSDVNTLSQQNYLQQLEEERRKEASAAQRTDEMTTSRREREEQLNEAARQRFGALRGENVGRLDPYSQAGQAASQEQQALLGLQGNEAQQAAYGRFGDSPGQQWMQDRIRRNLLRSTSATGGLGGGNVLTALQEQGQQFAAQDLDAQMARLGALSGAGQQAAGTIAGLQGEPAYIQTGQDIGVASGADYAYDPVTQPTAAPAPTKVDPMSPASVQQKAQEEAARVQQLLLNPPNPLDVFKNPSQFF